MSSWDRQEKETAKAYAAFQAYLSLAPKDRSVAAAYALGKGEKLAEKGRRAPGFYERWATKWNWKERAAQFDEHQFSERWAVVEGTYKEAQLEAADLLRDTVLSLREDLKKEYMQPKEKISLINSLRELLKGIAGGDDVIESITVSFGPNMPPRPKPEVSPATENAQRNGVDA